MKALIASGLCVVFGVWAADLFGQEVQWRASPLTAPSTSVSPAGATSASADVAPAKSVTLSRPIAVAPPDVAGGPAPGSIPAFRPVLGKPSAVVRGKVFDDDPRPLPPGPVLISQPAFNDPAPDKKEPAKPKFETIKPAPMAEFIPTMPTMVDPMPAPAWESFHGPGMHGNGTYGNGMYGNGMYSHDPFGHGMYSHNVYGDGIMMGGDCCDSCQPSYVSCAPYQAPYQHAYQPSYASCQPMYSSCAPCPGPCSAPLMDCCTPSCSPGGDCFSGCGDPCGGGGCSDCPSRGKYWISGAYLLWSFKAKNCPPLVTLSPVGTNTNLTGVLGQPTTLVLYDQDDLESNSHNGARFHFGIWFDRFPCTGIEADYFFLSKRSKSDTFGSQGDPQLARPIIVNGAEGRQLVAAQPLVTGSVNVSTYSEMWGAELNLRHKGWCTPLTWVDFFWGFRHVQLSEGITIFEDLIDLNAAGNAADDEAVTVRDSFTTRNMFNGPQVGFQCEYQFWNRWFLQATAKVAVGNMHQRVTISGRTTTRNLATGASQAADAGILAGVTNVGRYQRDRFAVVPEVGLKLGFEITENWRIWAGYDFLYMSSVVRPGDQIDRVVNPTLVPFSGVAPNPNPQRPAVLFRTTDFWAQGVNFGLEYKW